MKKYSEDRSLTTNILWCLFALVGLVVVPSLIFFVLMYFFTTSDGFILSLYELFANFIFIGALILIYFKDLKREFKIFKKNPSLFLKRGFKLYFVGLMAMVFFNLVISQVIGDVSSNENQVREMLFSSPAFTMISLVIVAPLSEELIFRKSLMPIFKNKWFYAFMSGLLFGGAHLLTNFLNNTFVLTDLIYLLPYGSLGFVFALMNHETKSTFTSMCIHAIHNGITGLLLLLIYNAGVM